MGNVGEIRIPRSLFKEKKDVGSKELYVFRLSPESG